MQKRIIKKIQEIPLKWINSAFIFPFLFRFHSDTNEKKHLNPHTQPYIKNRTEKWDKI